MIEYGSCFSGIEAASVAWEPLGWKPVFFSEIEKFPNAVLQYHYPDVPNYGDITKHKEWPDGRPGTIDLLVGGSPCQAFSIAGLRKGLDDPRGNLTLEFLGVIRQYLPRWLVWENVPGVLSDDSGAFAAFQRGLAELGYFFSWRILDAEYFSVPQRRNRVFLVGYLGDWRPPLAVLFERSSLQGDITPSREAREGYPGGVAACLRSGGEGGVPSSRGENIVPHVSRALKAKAQTSNREDSETYIPEVCGCLSDGAHHGGGLNGQDAYSGRIIAQAIPINTQIATRHEKLGEGTGFGVGKDGDPAFTVIKGHGHAVAVENHPNDSRVGLSDTVQTLSSRMGTGGNNIPMAMSGMQVRRLTEVECERLQGFPDNYTRIPWKGRPAEECPSGHRYKALGNSMAVPVMSWIGQRIQMVEDIMKGNK